MVTALAPLLLVLAAAVDPVGDLPPSLEAPPTTTTATTPAPTSTPSITVVLLPTVGLGVDEASRRAAAAALAAQLVDRAIVVDGATLPAAAQEALATCDGDACRTALDPLGATAVVTSSVGPLANDIVLTVRVRNGTGTQRLQMRGAPGDIDGLAARAVAAMPLDGASPSPSSSTSPTSSRAPGPPTTPKTPTPPATAPPQVSTSSMPPVAMVLLYFGLGFVPVVGSPLFLPFIQGFAAQEFGPRLVGLEFNDWGNAVAAGYLTYIVGFTLAGGAYVGGAALAASGASAGYALMAGGGLVLLATLAAEPVVFHLVASSSATPATEPER